MAYTVVQWRIPGEVPEMNIFMVRLVSQSMSVL